MEGLLFDWNSERNKLLSEPNNIQTETKTLKSKYLLAHFQKVQNIERCLERLPFQEEYMFLQTEKQFNAFTFIPFILKYKSITELFASTYSISVRVIESLIELYDQGMIEKITLLISNSMPQRNPVTIDKISSLAGARHNIELKYAWNHSKITLCKTKEDHFVIEGSGNWSENAAIEQYLFTNSKELFEFRKLIFDEY